MTPAGPSRPLGAIGIQLERHRKLTVRPTESRLLTRWYARPGGDSGVQNGSVAPACGRVRLLHPRLRLLGVHALRLVRTSSVAQQCIAGGGASVASQKQMASNVPAGRIRASACTFCDWRPAARLDFFSGGRSKRDCAVRLVVFAMGGSPRGERSFNGFHCIVHPECAHVGCRIAS